MQEQIIDSRDPRTRAGMQAAGWRLFFKTIIKSGILLGRNVKAIAEDAYSGATNVVAEAKAELDRRRKLENLWI